MAGDKSVTIRAYTVKDMLEILGAANKDVSVKVEATGFLNYGIQLSLRENLSEIVLTDRKVILRAFNREGWVPGERANNGVG